jgi:hypothetical protein
MGPWKLGFPGARKRRCNLFPTCPVYVPKAYSLKGDHGVRRLVCERTRETLFGNPVRNPVIEPRDLS